MLSDTSSQWGYCYDRDWWQFMSFFFIFSSSPQIVFSLHRCLYHTVVCDHNRHSSHMRWKNVRKTSFVVRPELQWSRGNYINIWKNRYWSKEKISFIIFKSCISFLFTEEPAQGLRCFTRDPAQLQGSILQTSLRKSLQGFGFTIIGGDRPDEFLQVKNVLPDGPAAHDNKIASGKLYPHASR